MGIYQPATAKRPPGLSNVVFVLVGGSVTCKACTVQAAKAESEAARQRELSHQAVRVSTYTSELPLALEGGTVSRD